MEIRAMATGDSDNASGVSSVIYERLHFQLPQWLPFLTCRKALLSVSEAGEEPLHPRKVSVLRCLWLETVKIHMALSKSYC